MRISPAELHVSEAGAEVWAAVRDLNNAEQRKGEKGLENSAIVEELISLRRERLSVCLATFRERLNQWREEQP